MTDADFRKLVSDSILNRLQPERRADLPGLCDQLGLPHAENDLSLSKAQYVRSRLQLLDLPQLVAVAEAFVARYSYAVSGDQATWDVEEAAWRRRPGPAVPKKVRHQIARALERVQLFGRGAKFMDGLRRLWVLENSLDLAIETFGRQQSNSLGRQIERHMIRNDDWSAEVLFDRLGAFEVSDRRFGRLLELLASADVHADETKQRRLVEVVNGVCSNCGVELRETGSDGGYPVFALLSKGGKSDRPKNLIFASREKPDLRLQDAVSNDIELMSGADKVLIYDRPFPAHGLRWRDLQAWWAEINGFDGETAKKTLYRRLLSSLPDASPPQRLLFTSFFRIYGDAIHALPALLPEVWLHWDPKTVRERGPLALLRFRMDFLLLLPDARVVLEVDGSYHYADSTGKAAPQLYGQMMAADRDLRLAGYDVYRFGASELGKEDEALRRTKEFFDRLFRKHGVTP